MKVSLLAVVASTIVALCSAADPECIERKLRGLPMHWPNPSDCSSFYRCSNKNIKREVACPENKEYNPKTGKCVSLGRGLCKLSLAEPLAEVDNVCNGQLSGSYVAAVGSCRSFYICNANLAYAQNCDAGSYFDETTSNCLPDVNDDLCWENLCLAKQDGQYVADKSDCHSFYVCATTNAYKQTCPDGSFFDWTSLDCMPGVCPMDETTTEASTDETTSNTDDDCTEETTTPSSGDCTDETTTPSSEDCTDETTTPSSEDCTEEKDSSEETTTPSTSEETSDCSCPDNIAEGEFVPNPDNCMLFYICSGGKLVETSCQAGNYFDDIHGACVRDTDGKCPQCQMAARAKRSIDDDVVQLELAEANEIAEKTESGETMVRTTGDKSNSVESLETEATQKLGPKCMGIYTENQIVPHPTDCAIFQICLGGQLHSEYCPPGTYYDNSVLLCLADTKNLCPTNKIENESEELVKDLLKSETKPTCLGMYHEGELVALPDNCRKFQICFASQMIVQDCGLGKYYDVATKECQLDTKNICPAKPKATCLGIYHEGQKITHPTSDCSKFQICYRGQLIDQSCGLGNYFNGITENCQVDTENVCAVNKLKDTKVTEKQKSCLRIYSEGQFLAHPTDCRQYQVCLDDQLIVQDCGIGNYFDGVSQMCQIDTQNLCPIGIVPKETESETETGAENNLESYLLAEKTCLGLYAEGQMVAVADDCQKFQICIDGTLLVQDCGSGNYFDSFNQHCQLDTRNWCAANRIDKSKTKELESNIAPESMPAIEPTCLGMYFEGNVVALPNECRKFRICFAGQMIVQDCGLGNYFDETTHECEIDTENLCPAKPKASCLGLYHEGQVVAHSDCAKFQICYRGQLIVQGCGLGSYYDGATHQCQLDTDNVCPSNKAKKTLESTRIRKLEPVTMTESCLGIYREGQFLAHPNDCRKYKICSEGQLITNDCGAGNYYDGIAAACQRDIFNLCPVKTIHQLNEEYASDIGSTCFGIYPEGKFLAHPTDCHKYKICFDGQLIVHDCGPNNYYDSASEVCRIDRDNLCPSNTVNESYASPSELKLASSLVVEQPTCSGMYYEGQFVALPNNCRKFNICFAGELTENDCGHGYYFDQTTEVCSIDLDNVCPNQEIAASADLLPCDCEQEEGQIIAHPTECSKFFTCTGGNLLETDCGKCNYFNNCTMTCEPDTDNVCWPACTECEGGEINVCKGQKDGTQFPDAATCGYIVCMGEEEISEPCPPDQYFDPATNECTVDVNAVCVNPCPATGDLPLPNQDCTKFYECSNGNVEVKDCPTGTGFDVTHGICLEQHKCFNTMCVGQDDGTTFPIASDPTQFIACVNELASLRSCDPGENYDETVGICMEQPSTDCNQAMCVTNPAGTYFPTLSGNPDTGFCVCRDNAAYKEYCQNGYTFNDVLNICYSNAPCDPDVCIDGPEYTVAPNRNDTGSFCLCVSDIPVIVDCPNNEIFNPLTLRCQVVAEIDPNCNPVYCLEHPDNTLFAAIDNPNGFCMCDGSGAIFHECEPGNTFNTIFEICLPSASDEPCDSSFCATSTTILFPAYNDPTSFCYCNGLTAIKKSCPTGEKYDAAYGMCMATDCSSTYCLETVNDGTTFPSNSGPHSFCFCNGTVTVLYQCQAGATYDVVHGVCISPIEAKCNLALCSKATKAAPYTTATLDEPNSFCQCTSATKVTMISCPAGKTYNAAEEMCVDIKAISSANLIHGLPCPSGLRDGKLLANPLACRKFFVCSAGRLHESDCGTGNYFDAHSDACVIDRFGKCNKRSCVGAYSEGDFVGHPLSRQLYYICSDEQLHEQDCGSGNIFDEELLTCVSSLQRCEPGFVYDVDRSVCLPEIYSDCDVRQCSDAIDGHAYAISALNDPNSFCYCLSTHKILKFECAAGKYFDDKKHICMDREALVEGSQCPRGYGEGSAVVNSNECRKFFICTLGHLRESDCGVGNYYDERTETCRRDILGKCLATATPKCVGSYQEGDFVAHPTSTQLYYVCYDEQLHEKNCGAGNVFNEQHSICVPENSRMMHMRSGGSDVNDSVETYPSCENDEKRSIPSNCSQYDICVDNKWRKRTCPNQRYYNPEQKKCLEPRDDTICKYAKVSGLKTCNNETEQHTLPGKDDNCAEYYRCTETKWHLQRCGKHQHYSAQLSTCIASMTASKDICAAERVTSLKLEEPGQNDYIETVQATLPKCQHTAVRAYADNCAMYLMCVEEVWWYQYCPLGMYFNRTHNYCMPNDASQCNDATSSDHPSTNTTEVNELEALNCTLEGSLRPSALACDKYYVCLSGKWHQQICASTHFFDKTSESCMPDLDDICGELSAVCVDQEMRTFPLNCTAYELCVKGEWQRNSCPPAWAFDDVIGRCVPNDGSCSSSGLRKACIGGDTRPLTFAENCTEFYYCSGDSWQLGECLNGDTYYAAEGSCVPHARNDKCAPLRTGDVETFVEDFVDSDLSTCQGIESGAAVPHPNDCSRFFLCLNDVSTSEQQCAVGSFFDAQLGYCRPNDGSCRVPLTGVCANATYDAFLANPSDCRAYYYCSSVNGTQLVYCPEGEYYHNYTRQCRIDHGECQQPIAEGKCVGAHGARLEHELYCNIYYACVRGLAIPVECPDNHQFNAVLGHCMYDDLNECQDGQLLNGTGTSHSCGNLTNGSFLPNRTDCTRYYICSEGQALPKQCIDGTFFDSQQLLCVPDDGSCPYVVDDDEPNNQPVPPDPIVCEGQHGMMMPDPANCHEFYVCINGKLRHERCYDDHFFNSTLYQCQAHESAKDVDGSLDSSEEELISVAVKSPQLCTDGPTNFNDLCAQISEGASIAEQGDCRRYISCQDDEPISQRCRNGESYDSLLGFCRQNDGTCLMENGQRVGECTGRHGQLTRDAENCRGYFVCINGQKIAGECNRDEYFNRTLNVCQKDILMQCSLTAEELSGVSCNGLSEAVLYPYIFDNCRSYFQCSKGVPNIHECAHGLYFDAGSTRCVKEIPECSMPIPSLQRAPAVAQAIKKCENALMDRLYANVEDQCHSYYICEADGTVAYTTCPIGTLFSQEIGECTEAQNVICDI